MAQDDVQLQVIVVIGVVLAIQTGEAMWTAFVVSADVGGEIGSPREGMGTEWALEAEVWI